MYPEDSSMMSFISFRLNQIHFIYYLFYSKRRSKEKTLKANRLHPLASQSSLLLHDPEINLQCQEKQGQVKSQQG
jgi:hypothetical protein